MKKRSIWRALTWVTCVVMLLSLVGCGQTPLPDAPNETTTVPSEDVTTEATAEPTAEPTTKPVTPPTQPTPAPLQVGGDTFTLDGKTFEMGTSPKALFEYLGTPKKVIHTYESSFGAPWIIYEYDHVKIATFSARGVTEEILAQIYFLDNTYSFDGLSVGDTVDKLDTIVSSRRKPTGTIYQAGKMMGGPGYRYRYGEKDTEWLFLFPDEVDEYFLNTEKIPEGAKIEFIALHYMYMVNDVSARYKEVYGDASYPYEGDSYIEYPDKN